MTVRRFLAALLLASSVRAEAESPHLSADVAHLDFGALEPVTASAVLPGRINLVVSSAVAWEVTVAVSADGGAQRLPLGFVWRAPGDRFRDLTPLVPTPIAAGGPTGGGTFSVTVDLKPVVSWETPTGRHRMRLQFFLNGAISFDARIAVVVLPRVDVVLDTAPLDSPLIDPTRPGSYAYARRVARITSNVAWRLVAWLENVPERKGSPRSLESAVFRVAVPPAAAVSLAPGARVTIAKGEATTTGVPVTVPVDVAVDLPGGEISGRYAARLRLSADPEPSL